MALGVPINPMHQRYIPFEERLRIFGEVSLQERRIKSLAITYFKILQQELHSPLAYRILNNCISTAPARTRYRNYFVNTSFFSCPLSPSSKAMHILNQINIISDIITITYGQIKSAINIIYNSNSTV